MPITVRDLRAFKERGERFAMLTCYDTTFARLLDDAGIPILLVGDVLGQVVLGYPSTVPVTMDEMIHHTRAVARGADNAFVLGDLPFMSYQASVEEGMRNAGRLLKEGGANGVKLEGGRPVLELVGRLTEAGIPVMGHLGLTPQSINQLSGHRVQGRLEQQAEEILRDAKDLEAVGAFALVLEAVPADLAAKVTAGISIPTIGIGAGPHCTGQVLVLYDFLGMTDFAAKYLKRYAELGESIKDAAKRFQEEVAIGSYPGPEHAYE